MNYETQERRARLIIWVTAGLFFLSVAALLIYRVSAHGMSDGIALALLILIVLPPMLFAIIKLFKILQHKRMDVDLPSDHRADLSLFSGVTIKHILIGVGIVVLLLFIIFIPAPWNVFVLLGGALAIFSSIRYLG